MVFVSFLLSLKLLYRKKTLYVYIESVKQLC